MDNMHDIVVIVGLSSVALMWAFSLVGAAATVYDTVRDPIDGLLKRFKG